MIFKEKEITLKNGQCCILRNVCSQDAERLIKYLKETRRKLECNLSIGNRTGT